MSTQRNTTIHFPRSLSGGELYKNIKLEPEKPVIFLAGPVRNAPKWQEEAVRIFLDKNKSVFVAAPIRDFSADLASQIELDNTVQYASFERQRAWEQYYLYKAAQSGCIVFWLPKEAAVKEFPDKLYAHITMLELGEWIARAKLDSSINLVVGTDGDFPEWHTVEFELRSELPEVFIGHSLAETVETALRIMHLKNT